MPSKTHSLPPHHPQTPDSNSPKPTNTDSPKSLVEITKSIKLGGHFSLPIFFPPKTPQ